MVHLPANVSFSYQLPQEVIEPMQNSECIQGGGKGLDEQQAQESQDGRYLAKVAEI